MKIGTVPKLYSLISEGVLRLQCSRYLKLTSSDSNHENTVMGYCHFLKKDNFNDLLLLPCPTKPFQIGVYSYRKIMLMEEKIHLNFLEECNPHLEGRKKR